jgi:hypothetical protein
MYSHIIKGYTVGQTVSRRIFRQTFSALFMLAGFFVIEAFIWAFWPNNNYWSQAAVPCADGTRIRGIMRGALAWCFDLLGALVGAIVGPTIGFLCFFPDKFLVFMAWLYETVLTGFAQYASFVGKREIFLRCGAIKNLGDNNAQQGLVQNNNPAAQPAQTIFQSIKAYLGKAWNVSAGTFGVGLAFFPLMLCFFIEKCLPIGSFLSKAVNYFFGYAGTIIGACVLTVPFAIVRHALNLVVRVFRGFRTCVRKVNAFVYAKTDQAPVTSIYNPEKKAEFSEYVGSGLADDVVHGSEFRFYTTTYHNMSAFDILTGPSIEFSVNGNADQGVNGQGGNAYHEMNPGQQASADQQQQPEQVAMQAV